MGRWPALDIPHGDELVHAFLTDFNLSAIDESRFFFHTEADRDRAAVALRDAYPALSVTAIDVPDEDWAARSQAALRAVRVGGIVVAPPWDIPEGTRETETVVVVIQPSMGFGTAHHATTRLCLAALQQIDLHGKTVIDVGTGSGVLAIAARRLGAAAVLAIDDDPDAITSAEENLVLNNASRIALEVTDLRSSPIGQFDVVTANLTGGLLIATAARLQSFARPGGDLVLSGFLDHEVTGVLQSFGDCVLDSRNQEDEWVCVTLIHRR